jgi:NAD-dependent dihydropyrimidine dehydrogenase PreA subunit
MKRHIISISEETCTGCGQCIPDCPEGALQVIDGKARLISDLFCDGLGACIGTCPESAITVIEREADAYDEKAVMQNIVKQGDAVTRAHLEHLAGHGKTDLYRQAVAYLEENQIPIPAHNGPEPGFHSQPGVHHLTGCPGSAARSIERTSTSSGGRAAGHTGSELRQWPVQLALLNPAAGYFDDCDLLIAADCTSFAYADFHQDFLAGKILVIFCPKLDAGIDGYITKLKEIFTLHRIRSVTLVHMEVPCCSGIAHIFIEALKQSGKKIPVTGVTVTIQGEIR